MIAAEDNRPYTSGRDITKPVRREANLFLRQDVTMTCNRRLDFENIR
jgi:hypothetical protein